MLPVTEFQGLSPAVKLVLCFLHLKFRFIVYCGLNTAPNVLVLELNPEIGLFMLFGHGAFGK